MPGRHEFRREGEYWTITYEGVTCRLRDSKGLRQLAHLLRHPGMKIPAQALLAVGEAYAAPAVTSLADQDVMGAGKQTVLGLAAERARVTVTRNIKLALNRIAVHHPDLARHLEATIRRGYLCSYTPDPRAAVEWE